MSHFAGRSTRPAGINPGVSLVLFEVIVKEGPTGRGHFHEEIRTLGRVVGKRENRLIKVAKGGEDLGEQRCVEIRSPERPMIGRFLDDRPRVADEWRIKAEPLGNGPGSSVPPTRAKHRPNPRARGESHRLGRARPERTGAVEKVPSTSSASRRYRLFLVRSAPCHSPGPTPFVDLVTDPRAGHRLRAVGLRAFYQKLQPKSSPVTLLCVAANKNRAEDQTREEQEGRSRLAATWHPLQSGDDPRPDGRATLERVTTGRGEVAEMAFTALVERHGPMVSRVCRALLSGSRRHPRRLSGHLPDFDQEVSRPLGSGFAGSLALPGRLSNGDKCPSGVGPTASA